MLGLILVLTQPGFATMSSLNYTISTSVISGGGATHEFSRLSE